MSLKNAIDAELGILREEKKKCKLYTHKIKQCTKLKKNENNKLNLRIKKEKQ